MPKDFWYWLIIAIWVLFGFTGYYRQPERRVWYYWGGDLILLLLFVLIGLTLFKDPFSTLVK